MGDRIEDQAGERFTASRPGGCLAVNDVARDSDDPNLAAMRGIRMGGEIVGKLGAPKAVSGRVAVGPCNFGDPFGPGDPVAKPINQG